MQLEGVIKKKIKDLFTSSGVKLTKLSLELGYSQSFLSNLLRAPNKFFNLEHIEKICNALNYPVWKLFVEDEKYPLTPAAPPQVAAPQAEYQTDDPLERLCIEKFRKLSPAHKQQILGQLLVLEETEKGEAQAPKKANAA